MTKRILICLIASIITAATSAQSLSDNEQLERAIEYFQSNKYQESLMIFEQLEKKHKLNPRYIAYMGLCYYSEWDFKKAYEHFETALPQLQKFSPKELSVYYYSCAESYFALEKYDKAMPHYEKALSLCYDNEKGDIYFRLGFCFIQKEEWQQAIDNLTQAQHHYTTFRNTLELQARLRQIENMIVGCREQLVLTSSQVVTNE